jgi:1,2-phenylacetyl-CoA epoxidase catalytic subunit
VETENGPQMVAALVDAGDPRAQERVARWIWEAGELFRRALEQRERSKGKPDEPTDALCID